MEFLIKNKNEQFFQNICIYCMKIEKYTHLIKKYKKIKGVYTKPSEIIKFIEDVSSYDTKEFPFTKIVHIMITKINIMKDMKKYQNFMVI